VSAGGGKGARAGGVPRNGGGAREGDDARAFAEAMRGTTPLSEQQRARRARVAPGEASGAKTAAPPPLRRPTVADAAEDDASLADLLTGAGGFQIETVGETVAARANGIDARILRRLRDGQFPIDDSVDLHRHARAEALAALERFVAGAATQGRRCLLVIHGRGHNSDADGPVLRPAVWHWLASSRRGRAAVMAFASAPPAHGGPGATLVLLRKRT
jgi:DNA-nicking Smr family endonuclease